MITLTYWWLESGPYQETWAYTVHPTPFRRCRKKNRGFRKTKRHVLISERPKTCVWKKVDCNKAIRRGTWPRSLFHKRLTCPQERFKLLDLWIGRLSRWTVSSSQVRPPPPTSRPQLNFSKREWRQKKKNWNKTTEQWELSSSAFR
jgi:hypothetical protein